MPPAPVAADASDAASLATHETIAAELDRVRDALPEGWSVKRVSHSDRSASLYAELQPSNQRAPAFLLRVSDHPQPRDRYRQVDFELGSHEDAYGSVSSEPTRDAFLWALDQYERGALRRTHTVREF